MSKRARPYHLTNRCLNHGNLRERKALETIHLRIIELQAELKSLRTMRRTMEQRINVRARYREKKGSI